MNKIVKHIGIIILLISLVGCEEKEFQEPDIALASVYSITEITGPNMPVKINIYQNEPLIIEYTTDVNVEKFTSSGFSDASTENEFDITVNKIVDNSSITYNIKGDKATGAGKLTVTNQTTSEFDVIITESEVYN